MRRSIDSRGRLGPLRDRAAVIQPDLSEESSGTAPDEARPVRAVTGGWVPSPAEADGGEAVDEVPFDDGEQVAPVRVRRERRGPWGRLAERWVPEPLRDSRIDPGRRGALVLTLVAAIAAVAAAVGVWRERPAPRPVENAGLQRVVDSPRSGTVGSAVPGTSPAVAAAAQQIVVSVTGAVHRPGLVRLPPGSRVADALAAAGGVDVQGDTSGLNLAEKLTDGRSVSVPVKGSVAPSGATPMATAARGSPGTAASAPVNLNQADLTALDALPGVGPTTAANIIAWRDRNGPFTSVEQLQEIPGIGPAKFAVLAPLVTV